jgi:transcriptional regulator with XRE-family HTH domain
VRKGLDQQVALFLQRKRGSESYAAFGRKVGLSASTLFRLENRQQSITVQKLEQVLSRLKSTMGEVFPPEG